jgi:hypothetical protein
MNTNKRRRSVISAMSAVNISSQSDPPVRIVPYPDSSAGCASFHDNHLGKA